MNKAQLDEDTYLGDAAETLMTNPAYQAAIARVKARIFDQWSNTGLFQRKERIELWRLSRVVGDFERELAILVEDANIAREDLKKLNRNDK